MKSEHLCRMIGGRIVIVLGEALASFIRKTKFGLPRQMPRPDLGGAAVSSAYLRSMSVSNLILSISASACL